MCVESSHWPSTQWQITKSAAEKDRSMKWCSGRCGWWADGGKMWCLTTQLQFKEKSIENKEIRKKYRIILLPAISQKLFRKNFSKGKRSYGLPFSLAIPRAVVLELACVFPWWVLWERREEEGLGVKGDIKQTLRVKKRGWERVRKCDLGMKNSCLSLGRGNRIRQRGKRSSQGGRHWMERRRCRRGSGNQSWACADAREAKAGREQTTTLKTGISQTVPIHSDGIYESLRVLMKRVEKGTEKHREFDFTLLERP